MLQTPDSFSREAQIPLPTLDRSSCCVGPEKNLAAQLIPQLTGQRPRHIGEGRGQRGCAPQPRCAVTAFHLICKRSGEHMEGVFEVYTGGRVCAQLVRKLLKGFVCEVQGIQDPDTRQALDYGHVNPLSTGIR